MNQRVGPVFRRGAVWWIRYSYRGKQLRESSTSTVRADAVKLYRRRMAEIGNGRLIGPDAERTTFTDLVTMLRDDYKLNGRKSVARVNIALKHLGEFFGRDRVADITTDRVSRYARRRQEDDEAAPATIRYELVCLKRALNLARRAGKAGTLPYIPSIAVNNARQGFFEPAEFEAVLANLDERLRPLMRFLYLTGWRKSDALNLTWRNVDFDAGIVRLEVGTTKNGDGREFPFAALPELAELLRQQRQQVERLEREEGRIISAVFTRNGKPIRSYYKAWNKATEAAGLGGRLVHDL